MIVLFDGVCVFCNRTVNFILDRDPGGRIRFCPLQSERAAELLARLGHAQDQGEGDPKSIVVVDGNAVYFKSRAFFMILSRLGGGWKLLSFLRVIPAFVADLFYDAFARHRYRWFGKLDSCRLPSPEERARFL